MEVLSFKLILPKKPDGTSNHEDFQPNQQEAFSQRLGELRRNKVNVAPFVVIKDSNRRNGNRWIKYRDYKKSLKKEG